MKRAIRELFYETSPIYGQAVTSHAMEHYNTLLLSAKFPCVKSSVEGRRILQIVVFAGGLLNPSFLCGKGQHTKRNPNNQLNPPARGAIR